MLEVNGISKSYPGGVADLVVLDDVSFTLEPGGRMAIMGPSGSGKSTLLSILGTLEEPTTGSLRLDGIDPFAGSAASRAGFRNRRIGFVFQEHHLLPGCTALDNVLVPALATGRVSPEIVARGQRLLDRVGLGDRMAHRPGELSGGERQRVAVARALLLSPRLILADELSPDNCRLWDLKSGEKLDRDRFDRELGNVEEGYQEVARRLGILPESGPSDMPGPLAMQ